MDKNDLGGVTKKEWNEMFNDEENFRQLAKRFNQQYYDEYMVHEETSDDFKKFQKHGQNFVTDTNIDHVFQNAGSEIEKAFLNSFILMCCKSNPLGLYITPPMEITKNKISMYRGIYSHLEKSEIFFTEIKERYNELNDGNFHVTEKDVDELTFHKMLIDFGIYESVIFTLQPQMPELKVDGKKIRPDVFAWMPRKDNFNLIIECDGYEYHSDKKTFTSDRKRDRAIKAYGMEVIRYSGSEIFNNPVGVSIELYEFIFGKEENEE